MTHSQREVLGLLQSIGARPRKALGQNFVVDPNLVRRIARLAAAEPGEWVIEVGPGLGSLTLALNETGARVAAVEVDEKFAALLASLVDNDRNRIVCADAMRFDFAALLRELGVERCSLVANLPYNIATPLIADLLDNVPGIDRMVVMVQREVALRLVAGPGDEQYGIPSVKVAFWAHARLAMTVPREVFYPRPNVESAVVVIERRPQPVCESDPARVFALVRKGFGQRRKMLRGALRPLASEDDLVAAGIGPQQRAEELSVDDWCRLAAARASESLG